MSISVFKFKLYRIRYNLYEHIEFLHTVVVS